MLFLCLFVLFGGSFAWCKVITAQRTITWICKNSLHEAMTMYENLSPPNLEQNTTNARPDFSEWIRNTTVVQNIEISKKEPLSNLKLPFSDTFLFWKHEELQDVIYFGMTSSKNSPNYARGLAREAELLIKPGMVGDPSLMMHYASEMMNQNVSANADSINEVGRAAAAFFSLDRSGLLQFASIGNMYFSVLRPQCESDGANNGSLQSPQTLVPVEFYNRTLGPRGSHLAKDAFVGTITLESSDTFALLSPSLMTKLESPILQVMTEIWRDSERTMVAPQKKKKKWTGRKKQPVVPEYNEAGRTLTEVGSRMVMDRALQKDISNSMGESAISESGNNLNFNHFSSLAGPNDKLMLAFQIQDKHKARRHFSLCR